MSIYQQYFALNCEPFSIVPDPGFLYPSSQHRQAVAHLKYGLDREGGFVLLTGEVGTGKTTLTRTLLKRMPAHVRVAYVLNSTLEVTDVLASICQELSIDLPKSSKTSLTKNCIDALNSDLITAHAEGKKTLVVIEEAQNLTPEVLEILRLLSNLETATHKLLHILLVGQPELLETLAQKDQRQLNQRVVARFHLLPLAKSDVANYVNHRLHHAGANRAIFESAAMTRLFKLTKGVPRLINLICHHALLAAYATGAKTVSAKLVKNAAKEIFDTQIVEKNSSRKWLVALFIAGIFSLLIAERYDSSQLNNPVEEAEIIVDVEPVIPEQVQPLIEVVESEEILMEPLMQAVIPVSEPDVTQDSPAVLTNPFADLFAAWSIEVEPLFSEEEVFALAEINNLGAEKLTDAENLQLVAIDRPGIIWIKEDNGRLKSHLLMALDDDSVLLKTDSGDRRESLQWFNERWNGAYLFLWHSPSDIKSLRLGDKDSIALDWVQSQLQLIDSNYLPFITGGNYTEVIRNRVLDFQTLQGIRADGVVGRQTIMRLNQLADPNIPRLGVVELEEGNL
ncbi:MAG: AAA family ATPase [Porticoccaceae bacterium]|tara:strand:- start:1384 stop:3078 length:1695 start_codon:yes stop_codon:yes gene_type:complete